eukprot:2204752-Alexandrium_andersonii.AAC.1
MPPAGYGAAVSRASLRNSCTGSSLRTARQAAPTLPVPGTMNVPSTVCRHGHSRPSGWPGASLNG